MLPGRLTIEHIKEHKRQGNEYFTYKNTVYKTDDLLKGEGKKNGGSLFRRDRVSNKSAKDKKFHGPGVSDSDGAGTE